MAEASPTPLSLPDLCPDVIFTIADQLDVLRTYRETPIKNLALTNRHLRMVLTPYLFKRIHIYQPICQLTPTTLPRQYGRTCKVDMFGSMWWWCSGSYVSSKDALDLFECIRDLEELRTLEVSMMTRSVDMFVKAFVDTERGLDFRINHIERLVVTRSAAFLAAHFPYLKGLVVRDEKDCVDDPAVSLIERLTPIHPQISLGPEAVPFLTCIDAAAVWSIAEVAALAKTFPRLRYLRMRTAWRQYRATTTEIIATLSQALPELATLHMVKSSSIDGCTKTIFHGRPHSCSAAAYRKLLWLENERLRVDAENNTARCAFASIASLTECWLGERVARKLPDIDVKTGGMRWMWERNTEEDGESGREYSTQWDISFSRGYSAIVVPSEIGM